MNKKELISLFFDVIVEDHVKYGFSEEDKNNYIDKFLNATNRTNVAKLNKLIDQFEDVLRELSPEFHDDEFDKSYREHRFKQYLFKHDELKEAIKERKVWVKRKKAGIRNYMK